jgi:hypothetical protein
VRFLDKVIQHLLGHFEIGNDPVFLAAELQRADMAEAHGKIVGLALNGTGTARKPV